MRRGLTARLAALVVVAACASASPPPGGPEDHAPPQLLRITPDTNALNVRERYATFTFDETINDRGSGPQEVENFFLVSPSDGSIDVEWRGSRIDVRPHNGFRPNTAYTVTMLPGLGDLRGNVMKTGASVVFSTGASIPTLSIAGRVFDWMAERPVRAFIQAVTPDSIVYLAQSDSAGAFSVGPLPEGRYLVRAIVDQNNNRALDRNEPYDSAAVVAPQTAPIELLAIARDTLPVRALTVATGDSVTLRVTLDRPVLARDIPPLTAFRLVGPDSAEVPIRAVLTLAQEQQQAREAQQAAADSARRADSLAGKAPAVPLPPTAAAAARPDARAPIPAAKPSAAPPITLLVVRLARRLAPVTTYRLTITGLRALSGKVATVERSFTTPKPPAPPAKPDSAKADSAKAVPRPPAAP